MSDRCSIQLFFSCYIVFPSGQLIYPSVLSFVGGCAIFWFDYDKAPEKTQGAGADEQAFCGTHRILSCKTTYEDEDYRRIIEMLTDEYRYLETDMNGKYEDMIEYYTMWGSSD